MRSVRVQQVAPGAAPHDAGIEPGSFDEDVLRLGRDHCVPAAHDAGETDGFLLVGDDEVIGIERALHSVQSPQLLAFAGAADDDAALELVEVKDVGGLANGERAVIRGVDRVGDGFLLEQTEALGDDAGGGDDLHIAQRARGKAAAEF